MPNRPFPSPVDTSTVPQTSSDERQLLERLSRLEDEAMRAKERWVSPGDIDRDLRLYEGAIKTADGKEPKFFQANFIESFIETMVAQLTDNRPIFRVRERKAGLKPAAQAVQTAIQALWDEAELQRQLYHLAFLAATTRSAGLYVGWSWDEQDLRPEVLSIDQVLLSPDVVDASRAGLAEYVIIKRIVPLAELQRLFGARAGHVQPDQTVPGKDTRRSMPSRTANITDFTAKGDQTLPDDAVDRVAVKEFVYRDRQVGADGQPLFPTYRRTIRAGDVILKDHELPFWDGIIPLDWYDWRMHPKNPWGRSEPARLEKIQLAFNQLLDGTIHNQVLSNILTVVGDQDSLTDADWKALQKLDQSILLRKKTRQAANPSIQPPPAFGVDRLTIAQGIMRFAQLLSGLPDVALGQDVGSLQSGKAVEGLQEGANTKTRARASRMEDLMKRVGQKVIARLFQFVPSDQVFSWLGPTNEALSFAFAKHELFFLEPNEVRLDERGTLRGTLSLDQFRTRLERRPRDEIKRVLNFMRFEVVPGSSQPGSRVERAQLMAQLLKLGAASRKAVLEAADFPDPEAMIREAEEDAQGNSILQSQTRRRTDQGPSGMMPDLQDLLRT